jgi:hypothetical protein
LGWFGLVWVGLVKIVAFWWNLELQRPIFYLSVWLFLVCSGLDYIVTMFLVLSIVPALVTMFLVHVLVLYNYSVLKHCAHIRCTHIVCTYSIRSAHVYYMLFYRPCTRHYVPRTCTRVVFVSRPCPCIRYAHILSMYSSLTLMCSLHSHHRVGYECPCPCVCPLWT